MIELTAKQKKDIKRDILGILDSWYKVAKEFGIHRELVDYVATVDPKDREPCPRTDLVFDMCPYVMDCDWSSCPCNSKKFSEDFCWTSIPYNPFVIPINDSIGLYASMGLLEVLYEMSIWQREELYHEVVYPWVDKKRKTKEYRKDGKVDPVLLFS